MTKISHISWGGYDKGFYGITSYIYCFKIANYAKINTNEILSITINILLITRLFNNYETLIQLEQIR